MEKYLLANLNEITITDHGMADNFGTTYKSKMFANENQKA